MAGGNEGLRPCSRPARRRLGGPCSQRCSSPLPSGNQQPREPEHPARADPGVPRSLNYTISSGNGEIARLRGSGEKQGGFGTGATSPAWGLCRGRGG